MRRILCLIGMVTMAVLGASRQADASMILTLTDVTGGTSVTCDNSVGGCSAAFTTTLNGSLITFSGTVGNFSVVFTIATGNQPGSTTATLDLTNLVITNLSGTAGVFTIDITSLGYTLPTGPLMTLSGSASLSTSNVGSGGSVLTTSYVDPNNLGALLNAISCSMAITSNNSCAEPGTTWTRNAGAFSIRNVQSFSVGGNGTLNSTTNTSVSAIPEPASMFLVGAGLFGLASSVRRRRRAKA